MSGENEFVEMAKDFAIKAHGDQKYNGEPYLTHLEAVHTEISRINPGVIARAAAYLHDVIEDTEATIDDVKAIYDQDMLGDMIGVAVSLLTDEPGENRKERKTRTYNKLTSIWRVGTGSDFGSCTGGITQPAEKIALQVKIADRLANVKACLLIGNDSLLKMYQEEHEDFKAAVYRDNIAGILMDELDKLIGIRGYKMTLEELERQRRSFVFGNTNIGNPDVTREMVDEVAEARKKDDEDLSNSDSES